MGAIEFYGKQMDNLDKLIAETIKAYVKVVSHACHCGKCDGDYVPNFSIWNPILDYNNTWNIIRLLEGFGYTRYDCDAFFYTFYIICPKSNEHDDLKYEGDGLNFGQAVCNALIKFANDYKFSEQERL
jgi:hypothetical protein